MDLTNLQRTTVYAHYADDSEVDYKDLPEEWTMVNRIKYRNYPIEHQFVGPWSKRKRMQAYLSKIGRTLLDAKKIKSFRVNESSEHSLDLHEPDPNYVFSPDVVIGIDEAYETIPIAVPISDDES